MIMKLSSKTFCRRSFKFGIGGSGKNGSTSTKGSDHQKGSCNGEIKWELRPGGMLVQKRETSSDHDPSLGPLIKIKVSHGSCYYDVTIPSQSTFGDLKKALERESGLEPNEQRLLFRGKERENAEFLHMVGVKDMSKVVLLEDPAAKERKLKQMKNNDQVNLKAFEQLVGVRAEVDKLSYKVAALVTTVSDGIQVEDKEFVVLTELLMQQLLKLDTIEANSEAKVQRRTEVHRVQSLVDILDNLRAGSSNPFTTTSSNTVLVTTKWETFEGGVGSLNAPAPVQSATRITQEWEHFD